MSDSISSRLRSGRTSIRPSSNARTRARRQARARAARQRESLYAPVSTGCAAAPRTPTNVLTAVTLCNLKNRIQNNTIQINLAVKKALNQEKSVYYGRNSRNNRVVIFTNKGRLDRSRKELKPVGPYKNVYKTLRNKYKPVEPNYNWLGNMSHIDPFTGRPFINYRRPFG